MDFWDDLTVEEIQAAFAKVNAVQPCPICSVSSWVIPAEKSLRDVVFANFIETPGTDDRSALSESGANIPVVMVICANCGFIRSHALGVVRVKAGRAPWPEKKDG